jgi:hypothetical protein
MYPTYGAPTWKPKHPRKLDLAQLIRNVLILKGLWHMYKSGLSPAEIAEVGKRQMHVPLNQQWQLRREANIVRKGGPAGPLMHKYFGDLIPRCATCGADVYDGFNFCRGRGRRIIRQQVS